MKSTTINSSLNHKVEAPRNLKKAPVVKKVVPTKPKKPVAKGKGKVVQQMIHTKVAKPTKTVNIPKALPAFSRPMSQTTFGAQLMREGHSNTPLTESNKMTAKVGELKNLRSDDEHMKLDSGNNSAVKKLLAKYLDAKEILGPDAKRYASLLQDPLRAEWGDEGEQPVRPLIYVDQVPPSSTAVTREFGQTTVTIPNNKELWIAFAVGPSNIVTDPSGYYKSDTISDDVAIASFNYFKPMSVTNPGTGYPVQTYQQVRVLGAPKNNSPPDFPQGQTYVNGTETNELFYQGCAGYYYLVDVNNQEGPCVDTVNFGLHDGLTYSACTPLDWGNSPTYSDQKPLDSSTFKYRPVAGGIQITPITSEFQLGGQIDISLIPYSVNEAFTTSFVFPDLGGAQVQSLLALPSHKVQRADHTFEAAWLPSRMDYSFYKIDAMPWNVTVPTTPGSPNGYAAFLPSTAANQNCSAQNARMWIRVKPAPGIAGSTDVTLSYNSFYEIAGKSVEQAGSVPRSNPSMGSKIGIAVQEAQLNEMPTNERTKQITDGTVLQVAKDHPKLGPMVEGSNTLGEAKSFLSSAIDIGKEILPIVMGLL